MTTTDTRNRITKAVEQAVRDRHKLFIPYYTAGFPDRERTLDIMLALDAAGSDILELGMPFSDPMADGPTIQQSCQTALEQGANLYWILDTIRSFRQQSELPVILFGYFNPILHYGIERFMQDAHDAGADGVLIADLPASETARVKPAMRAANMQLICLAAPTNTDEQLRTVEQATDDFVYCVSVAGVTGARISVFNVAQEFIKRAGRILTKPFVVGFGIGTPEDVERIGAISGGVVVGSALVKYIGAHADAPDLPQLAQQFIETLRAPLEK